MFMTKVGLILVTCVFTFLFTVAAHGATFVVNTTSDTVDATPGDATCADAGGMCSLRAAIGEANALAGDDIITVPAGTYTQTLVAANEDLNVGGDWDIRSNITINGAGAATTILQAAATPGTATERVMESPLAASVVTINGVTLRHGNKTGAAANATRGGGIRNVGIMTMNDCVVTLNNASGAGGVRNERTITLNNVTVSNNACNNGGTTCFGGGMYNTLAALSTVTINGSTFTNNTSTSPGANGFGFGAGLGIESGAGFNLVITNSSFTNNTGVGNGTGGSNGNGIRVLATAASTANITNSSFNNNSGSGGSSIQGSGIQAFTSGANGTLSGTWDGVTVNGNTVASGGALGLSATGNAMTITIRNSTISNNTSTGSAAGVGVANSGTVAGANSVINITNSTISGNMANGSSGGFQLEQVSAVGTMTANLNFCTVANNRANNDNSGADVGGGINRISGVLNLKNTVVADNTVGTGGTAPDIAGVVNSQDYNHIEDPTGATIGGTTTNNTTGDPQLGPLAANGGPTNTHLPGAASPLLNSIPNGTNDCGTVVTTDQRGQSRPSGTGCEKGSVEVAAVTGPFDISGRILTSDGRGIRNVIVVISGGSLPAPLRVQTGSFGTYVFNDLAPGTYTITVFSKRFTFATPSRMINLSSDITNENFVAEPGFGMRPGEEPDQR
jgi:large repetitive protein